METKETTKEILQDLILEGRKILLKKENDTQFIQVRFNHNDIDGMRKWRLIVDDCEFYTSEIIINISSRTETAFSEEFNGYRHHIVIDSNQVEFNKNIAYIS
jgi:hypothetical protein